MNQIDIDPKDSNTTKFVYYTNIIPTVKDFDMFTPYFRNDIAMKLAIEFGPGNKYIVAPYSNRLSSDKIPFLADGSHDAHPLNVVIVNYRHGLCSRHHAWRVLHKHRKEKVL